MAKKTLIKKNILVVRLFILISYSNKRAARCPKTFSKIRDNSLSSMPCFLIRSIQHLWFDHVIEPSPATCFGHIFFSKFFTLFEHKTCHAAIRLMMHEACSLILSCSGSFKIAFHYNCIPLNL